MQQRQKHTLQQLTSLLNQFQSLKLSKTLHFEQFNRIAIVHHSSTIEGSTLSMEETQILLTEGLTAKGKPLLHHHWVTDHYNALLFVLKEAEKKTNITTKFLQTINAVINKNTGQIRNMALGVCDDTKGDFRLGNVTAGSTYFVNYNKVIPLVNDLCAKLNEKIVKVTSIEEIYNLSFEAHYYLVTIHPWFDGNGRTARLLMNFIQQYHHVPLSLVFAEDRAEYITSLNKSRAKENTEIFYNFMCLQQIKYIQNEIDKYNKSKSGFNLIL